MGINGQRNRGKSYDRNEGGNGKRLKESKDELRNGRWKAKE